jgi:hypothetical protein
VILSDKCVKHNSVVVVVVVVVGCGSSLQLRELSVKMFRE